MRPDCVEVILPEMPGIGPGAYKFSLKFIPGFVVFDKQVWLRGTGICRQI